MKPTFSVIIAVFNGAATIGRAIESVLTQTRPPDELIVVDDGSTDGTGGEVARFGDRVTYIHQPNAGVSAARNAGAAAASGEWLAFLDADDVYYPQRLEWHAEWIAAEPDLDFLTGDEEYRTPDGRLLKTAIAGTQAGRMLSERAGDARRIVMDREAEIAAFVAEHFGDTPTLSLPRRTFLELGGYPPGRAVCEDVSLLIRLTARSRRIGVVLRPMAIYFVYPDSATRRDPVRANELTVEALSALSGELETARAPVRNGLAAGIRAARYNLALALLRKGQRWRALRAVWPSFAAQPGPGTLREMASIMRGLGKE